MYDEIDVYGVFVYWMMLDFCFNFPLGVPPPRDGFGVGVEWGWSGGGVGVEWG